VDSVRFDLPTERATRALGQALAPALGAGDLVILSGGLGVGKTFLARELCHALGVPAGVRITSPTFSLVHEFAGQRLSIRHADLYRIGGERELLELGLDAARDDGALLLVEWGEPYLRALGGDALMVSLALDPRRAELTATGPRSRDILAVLAQSRAALDASRPAR
jgi:tRNA threonylcarbamoyladenosine biosynthesis protein TsaE